MRSAGFWRTGSGFDFVLAGSDQMIAIIGAVGRLTDAGMGVDDATDTVLRILHESESGGRS